MSQSKRNFQLYLSASVALLVLVFSAAFSFFAYQQFLDKMEQQAIEFNRTFGRQFLTLLEEYGFTDMEKEQQYSFLNDVCQTVVLPNGGFICGANDKGELIAHPEIEMIQERNYFTSYLHNFAEDQTVEFMNLDTEEHYDGLYYRQGQERVDIISVIPVPNTDIRVLVHQNYGELHQHIRRILFPVATLSVIFSILIGFAVLLITNRMVRSYENQLEDQNDQLNRLNSKRRELLHVLVHDLTNPLGVLQSSLELYDQNLLEKAEFEEVVGHATRQGMEIISFVREMEALQEGKRTLELSAVSISQAVEESLQVVRQSLHDKELSIETDIDTSLEVIAEKTSLVNTVLNNILTNAVKFSHRGGTITIQGKRLRAGGTLRIRDYGIGIPETLLENIFSEHKATTRPGTDGESGTGFGMPLVKKIVELYGATITVNSWPEEDRIGGTEIILDFLTP